MPLDQHVRNAARALQKCLGDFLFHWCVNATHISRRRGSARGFLDSAVGFACISALSPVDCCSIKDDDYRILSLAHGKITVFAMGFDLWTEVLYQIAAEQGSSSI